MYRKDKMKLVSRSIFVLLTIAVLTTIMYSDVPQASAQTPPEEDLVYTPVTPCRIVDTRKAADHWVATYDYGPPSQNSGSGEGSYDLALDNSGNVFVTGYTSHDYDYGDYATVKYDTNGNELWVALYNGPASYNVDRASAIAVDGSGNVYVTGGSGGPNYNDLDYATVKYDSDGNELWIKRYNGPANEGDRAWSIAVDSSGNVYVTGQSDGIGKVTTIKYDTNGNELWVARYDGPVGGDRVALALDSSGNVHITARKNSDYVTVKYDTDGNQLWDASYDGPASSSDEPEAIAVDSSGNVYVTGYSTGFEPIPPFTQHTLDYATVKYDKDGNQLWVARYHKMGDHAWAITVDSSGNVYVTGNSGRDFYTIKYDMNGNELWGARYSGPASKFDTTRAIALDSLGNVYVTGQSDDPGGHCATVKYDPDGNELWVARYTSKIGKCEAMGVDGSENVYVTGWSKVVSSTDSDYITIKYDTDVVGGPLSPGDVRSYNVYGAVASQGGNPSGCPSPKGEPLAVALNVTAVPLSKTGWITAYPFSSSAPLASLVNYKVSAQNVANSGTVKTCFNCTKDISIKSGNGTTHVVIDVLGYYYAMP